ncbi:MAG TPA: CocE/NonD family hydrolase [Pseudonocardiaceae bacterium]
MFGKNWELSARRFDVVVEEDFEVPLADGNVLVGRMFRPVTDEPVPLLVGFHPYNNEFQFGPIKPVGFGLQRGWMEAGDPYFFARRGYAHGVFNVRGTGKSSGEFQFMGPTEADDAAEAIGWLAGQSWCTGNVGLFGVSYFSRLAIHVAMREPPALKAIFAPYGLTDIYRDLAYHGGILSYGFLVGWREKLDALRYSSLVRDRVGEEAYRAGVAALLQDDDVCAVPPLKAALENPGSRHNAFLVDILLNAQDSEFFAQRRVDYRATSVPAFFGACWGIYGLQLTSAFRNWEKWRGPKKLMIGPALYLDRPLYQLQYHSLRWFDHWLLGNDTGFMDEDAVELFMPGLGAWQTATEWPLPETKWTPFYLHDEALLSEHELWDHETSTSFADSPFHRGNATFLSPKLMEKTDLLGPAVFEGHISTSDTEALLFVSMFVLRTDGTEEELSRGWLRASQRALDEEGSEPWLPRHLHASREPLTPGEVYAVKVALAPMAREVQIGERIGLRVKLADDEKPMDPLRATSFGHIHRQTAARLTVHHSPDRASCVLLPITAGNRIGTYLSDGVLEPPGPIPVAKIQGLK